MGVVGCNHSQSKLFTYLAGTYAGEKFRAMILLRVQFHPAGGGREEGAQADCFFFLLLFVIILILLILLLQSFPIS